MLSVQQKKSYYWLNRFGYFKLNLLCTEICRLILSEKQQDNSPCKPLIAVNQYISDKNTQIYRYKHWCTWCNDCNANWNIIKLAEHKPLPHNTTCKKNLTYVLWNKFSLATKITRSHLKLCSIQFCLYQCYKNKCKLYTEVSMEIFWEIWMKIVISSLTQRYNNHTSKLVLLVYKKIKWWYGLLKRTLKEKKIIYRY